MLWDKIISGLISCSVFFFLGYMVPASQTGGFALFYFKLLETIYFGTVRQNKDTKNIILDPEL